MLNSLDYSDVSRTGQISLSLPVKGEPSFQKISPASSIQYTADNFDSTKQEYTSAGIDQPVLAPPTGTPLEASDFYSILAMLQESLHDSTYQSVVSNLTFNNQLSTARAATILDIVAAVNAATETLQQATLDLPKNLQTLNDTKEVLADKSSQLDAAQTQFDKDNASMVAVKQDLDNYPNDPIRQSKYQSVLAIASASSQKLEVAQVEQQTALANYNNAETVVIDTQNLITSAGQTISDRTTDYLSLMAQVPTTPAAANKEVQNAVNTLIECISSLAEVMHKYNLDKLTSSNKLFKDMQKALVNKFNELADKFEKALAEAQRKQKIMKIATKAFSGLVIALSGVAAFCSGGLGAGLVALAVTGTTVVDEVLDSKGDETLSSRAMDPIMKGLTQGFSNVIKKLNPDIDEKTAMIFATILATLTIAAVAAGSGALASKLLPSVGVASSGNIATLGRYINGATSITELSNNGMQTGMGIETAKSLKDVNYTKAEIVTNKYDQDLIERTLKDWMDAFCNETDESATITFLGNFIQQRQAALKQVISTLPA